MRILHVLGVLVLLCCRAEAVAPFRDACKLERQAALPFTIARGHINVPVTVNGRPLTFMVDTGGVYSVLSEKAVAALGLDRYVIKNGVHLADAAGHHVDEYAHIQSILFGTLKSENLTLMIANIAEDGVLAPDLLRNFDVDIDFDSRQVNLFKHHRCEDQVVYWTDDYAVVPFTLTKQGHIRLDVRVNGTPLRAFMDTGAPVSVIGLPTLVRELSLPAPKSFDRTIYGGNGGRHDATPLKLDSLQIAKFAWSQPVFFLSAHDGSWKEDDSDVLLGLRELSGLHLYIDYTGQKLYLSRRLPPSAP